MAKTNIQVGLDVSPLMTSAGQAKNALSTVEQALLKLEKAGNKNTPQYGQLATQKVMLQQQMMRSDILFRNMVNNPKMFQMGANGMPVMKMDAKHEQLIMKQINILEKLYREFAEMGDDDSRKYAMLSQINDAEMKKNMAMSGAMGGELAKERTLKGIGYNQVAGIFGQAMNTYIASIDRTATISAMGSGNLIGASIAETQRKANIAKGIGQTAQGLGSLGIMSGNLYGQAAGAALHGLGLAINSITDIITKDKTNRSTYAMQWELQREGAMRHAAILGNPLGVKSEWSKASNFARDYGFLAQDGMALLQEAAAQGIKGTKTAENVFHYERATGADRGVLSSIAFMSERYKAGDALRSGWAGLKATGMQTGQYNEFLRGMERIMSEGIQKGFVRSTDDVARSMTMLSNMTGGKNELWKGELGAQRLSQMNQGLDASKNLEDVNKIMAFRATKMAMEAANPGKKFDSIDVQMEMEKGLSGKYGAEILKNFIKLAETSEGAGNRGDITRRIAQVFTGGNYNLASDIFINRNRISSSDLPVQGTPDYRGNEFNWSVESARITQRSIETGMKFHTMTMKDAIEKAEKALEDAIKGIKREETIDEQRHRELKELMIEAQRNSSGMTKEDEKRINLKQKLDLASFKGEMTIEQQLARISDTSAIKDARALKYSSNFINLLPSLNSLEYNNESSTSFFKAQKFIGEFFNAMIDNKINDKEDKNLERLFNELITELKRIDVQVQ